MKETALSKKYSLILEQDQVQGTAAPSLEKGDIVTYQGQQYVFIKMHEDTPGEAYLIEITPVAISAPVSELTKDM